MENSELTFRHGLRVRIQNQTLAKIKMRAVADGVATNEVEVLIASGQRRACQAGGAADGVVVAGSGGLDMPLDNAVFDGGAIHQTFWRAVPVILSVL